MNAERIGAGRGDSKKGASSLGRSEPAKRGRPCGRKLDGGSGSGRGSHERSPETDGDGEETVLPNPDAPVSLQTLDAIGKNLARNLEKGDKREAFRQFELALARHFSAIILGNAGTQVKGFIDGILTVEEYRSRKSPDMDDKRKNPHELIEEFFTKSDEP